MIIEVKSNTNTRTSYLLTYKFGFIPQAFVGSIISLFTNYVTSRLIYTIYIISFLILISFLSFLFGGVIRKSQSDVKSATMIFVVLFLASPLSVTYLLGMNTERLDIFWVLLTLLALVFLKRPILRWTIPIVCAIAVSIHQGYMDTYMPALAILLLYEVYKNKHSKKSIAVFTFSCLSMIFLFMYFQFFPAKLPFDNAVDFATQLSKNADFTASAIMLHVGFFAPFKEWFTEYVGPITASYALPLGVTLLTYSLPLLIIFGIIWKKCISQTKNRFLKLIFILCCLAPLVFFPGAVLANDWDRYWAAVINNQFIFVFYFIYSNENVVINCIKEVGNFFQKHFLLLFLIIIFIKSFTFSESATNIFSFIQNKHAISRLIEDYINRSVNRH